MATLNRNGVNLVCDDQGSGSPPIVLIHGWSSNTWFLHPQMDYFSKSHRVVNVDLRGHGRSDAPEQDYTIGVFADDVAWTIAELGLDRPVVAGHSMGALVALEMGATFPDKIRAVVMIDPPPIRPLTPEIVASYAVINANYGAGAITERRRAFVDSVFLPRHNRSIRDEVQVQLAKANDYVTVNSMINGLQKWDSMAAAKACHLPTLNISAQPGNNDLAAVESLIENCVTGKTVGAGHLHQIEVADQVNSMIANFIREYVD